MKKQTISQLKQNNQYSRYGYNDTTIDRAKERLEAEFRKANPPF